VLNYFYFATTTTKMSDDSNGLNETLKCLIKHNLTRLWNC